MKDLLIENLLPLVKLCPKDMDLADFIDDPPCFEPESHCTRDAAFGYGYLRGVADALDMTSLEVLSHFDIGYSDFQVRSIEDATKDMVCVFCNKTGASSMDTEAGGWYHPGCKPKVVPCGHSACAQNFIDTGSLECAEGKPL